MKKLLLSVIQITCTLLLNATTYHVSNSGNDDWSGSETASWGTLQHAAGMVQAGDTVLVLAGEYSGFCMGWDDEAEGTAADPIVFKANPGTIIISDNINTDDGINLEGVSHIVVDGFTITNSTGSIARAGIRSVDNTGVVIRNNTIGGMGTWGILTGFSDNITIENNRCSYSIGEHGIYVGNSGDNPVIRGNTCHHNNGCGIHMNADASMGGDGIISNALVENNIIYENGNAGGSGINCDGVQNSIIRNNLIYENHAGGISLYGIDAAEPSYNNKVINNTILMPEDGRWALNIADGSSDCTVLNNILFANHPSRGGLVIDEAGLSGFTSDYNIVTDRFSADGDATIATLGEWQSETGHDEHSYVSTPGEVFISTTDFHLLEGCAPIDNGTSINAPLTDLEGRIRPWGVKFDIGAYEFGAPVLNPEILSDHELFIFPNPANEECFIKSENSIQQIEIIDVNGRLLKTFGFSNSTFVMIPVAGLGDGIYILRIHSGTSWAMRSIVIE